QHAEHPPGAGDARDFEGAPCAPGSRAYQQPASCPIPRAWCPRRQTQKRDRPGRGRAGSSLVKFERFYQCPSTKPPKTTESAPQNELGVADLVEKVHAIAE